MGKLHKSGQKVATKRTGYKPNGTLCWNCDNMRCSWRLSLTPVNGWDATPTKKVTYIGDNGEKKEVMSYKVTGCPEFQRAGTYANDEEWESGLVSE